MTSSKVFLLLALLAALGMPALAASIDPLQTPMILVNQIGYDLRGAKTFLVQLPKGNSQPGDFTIKSKADGKAVLRGALKPLGGMKSWKGDWAKVGYWRGDFTALATAGKYVIEVDAAGPIVSPTVTIAEAAPLRELAPFSGVSYFKGVRSEMGGWKADQVPSEACVIFCIGPGTLGLAKAYEADPKFWLAQGKKDAFIEEIRWGIKGLAFAQDKDGRFVGTNPDGRNDTWSGLGIAALAHLAGATYLTPAERADCLKRARLGYEYYQANEAQIEIWGSWTDKQGLWLEPLAHAAMTLACTELYDVDKDPRYLQSATAHATKACKIWNREWPRTGSWGMEMWQGGITPGCLMDFAIRHPANVPPVVKNALKRWADYVVPLSANPFAMPGWDRNHFLNPNSSPYWRVAENGRYITNAWALRLAAKWTGKPLLATFAQSNLDWIAGVNPGGICMIRDAGERQQESWSCLAFTGAIPNGMLARSTQDDSPELVGNQLPSNYSTDEPWSPYNGWILLALAAAGS